MSQAPSQTLSAPGGAALSPYPATSAHHRAIAVWLLACCALIFAMVVLGGATRLTGSGLSMVEWEPVVGVIPPLTEAQWQASFDKYRQFPEYQKKNVHMDLAGYKSIYWLEYFHRLLGRAIGIAFLVPFLYFLMRRRIEPALVPRLVTLFVLGGLQGLLGWYMVKSGLVHDPHVSQYRLTAHLAMAFLIYGYMLWVALGLLFPRARAVGQELTPVRRRAVAVTALIALTVLSGGFVAGLKAGFAFNTFPLMNGQWVPAGYFFYQPWWINFFENVAAVQFDHRVLATLTLIAVAWLWWYARRRDLPPRGRIGLHLMLAMVLIQVSLGIATLLLHVPIPLAATHQAGALTLFTLALFVVHAMHGGSIRPAAAQPSAVRV